MPRIATVWSGLEEDNEAASTVHEEGLVVTSIMKNEPTARNAEQLEESPFQEVAQVNGKHMMIYDLPEGQSINDFEARVRASIEEIPDNARVNARCYHQMERYDGEYWRDGMMRERSLPRKDRIIEVNVQKQISATFACGA